MSPPRKQRPARLPPPDLSGLAERLRGAMTQAALSQRDLAAAAGVAQPTIQALLKAGGADPRISTVAKLARALRVQAGWLAYG